MRLATTFYIILTFAFLAQGWAQPPEFTDVDFSSADSVASLYPDHPLDNLPQLSHKLTSPFNTEPEKFRSLFKWVCDNIANDYELYAANKKKRETLSGAELEAWNKHIRTITFKTLLDNHTTVCTGYAYLIRELSRQAGLSCEIIDGYGRNVVSNIGGSGIVNHSWNAVRLDGKWYLCDATWASGGIDPQQKVFLPKYNNAYFLSDPGFFVRNHYPQDSKWTLMDNNPSIQEFLNAPLIYYSAIRERIQFIEPSVFALTIHKGDELAFAFEGPLGLSRGLSLRIGNSSTSDAFTEQVTSGAECRYQTSHKFRFRGRYAVHVLLNENYLYSYDVMVK